MPRKVVPIVTGEIYHVYNRGVDKRIIFDDTQDYLRFYQSLHFFNAVEPITNFMFARSNENNSHVPLVSVRAYSLLPNHFHLLVEQKEDGGISEFMKRVLGGYTSYYNERNERSGSLFQGTFKRIHVDSDEQYRYLFAYVNENHIVHNIPRKSEVIYSSSVHYQMLAQSKIITPRYEEFKYNQMENVALAKSIFERRVSEKHVLHESG